MTFTFTVVFTRFNDICVQIPERKAKPVHEKCSHVIYIRYLELWYSGPGLWDSVNKTCRELNIVMCTASLCGGQIKCHANNIVSAIIIYVFSPGNDHTARWIWKVVESVRVVNIMIVGIFVLPSETDFGAYQWFRTLRKSVFGFSKRKIC